MSISEEFFPLKKPVFLFDASAFIYRGFYAYSAMQRRDGFPTSAIYSVTRMLIKILRTERPHYCAFILDGPGDSFRYELFSAYKQNRSKTPEDLVAQVAPVQRIVEALGIPIVVSQGAEADDYIASLAMQHEKEGVVIVGVDKDLRQCLRNNVILWDPSTKDEKIITYDSFVEQSGMLPYQWPDFQAIIGDSSDNIPGVKGIGEKTARKLFEHYKTLELIEEHIEELEPKIKNKLIPEMQNAYLYRELTRLSTTCCSMDLHTLSVQSIQSNLMEYIEEFELFSLRKEVEALYKTHGLQRTSAIATNKQEGTTTEQLNLFTTTEVQREKDDIPAKTSTIENLPHTESIVLYHTAEVLYIFIENQCYSCTQYTEDALYSYLLNVQECVSIDIKSLIRLYPRLLNLNIVWKDLAIMAYLLNPEEREYTLDSIASVWEADMPRVPVHTLDFMKECSIFFINQLQSKSLYDLYIEVEQPLARVLASIEHEGIKLDITALQELLYSVEKDIHHKEETIYQLAGKEFNIRSSQQLGHILFNEMGLSHKSKTKTGHFSTSQEILEKLASAHPIVEHILSFRTLEKLRSTYLEPLPKYADANHRIHTTLNQLSTATGRLSSSNPNLQNIPIRGALGEQIRACFCAKDGNVLIAADYSQIELRILAYLSQEETLLEAFNNKEDIHKRTASILYDIPIDSVDKEQRRNAKAINFGLLYGMGATKLAREIGLTLSQAKEFIALYFERLDKVKLLHTNIVEQAQINGYVTTLFGRRRYLPHIQSGNEQMASQARRQAVNTVIQGTAADIIKKAMVSIYNNQEYRAINAKLILQIHDELIIEVPEAYAESVSCSMVESMTSVEWQGERLPLIVEYGIATTWDKAH